MAGPGSSSGGAKGPRPDGPAGPQAANPKRCRVLVVDDEPKFLESVEAILATDLDVVTCTSAEQALKLLASTRFHLVCADYNMPGMNGLELLERVGQLPQTTSGLLITGSDDYGRVQGQSRYHVILKPFDPERLLSLALQLARLTEMRRSVQSLTDSVMPPESSRMTPPSSRRFEASSEPRSPSRPPRTASGAPPSSPGSESTPSPPSSSREDKR